MSQIINVLVFGTAGAGKTSLCNALTGENQKVSASAMGVTFKSYTYKDIEFSEGKLLRITDTVGLNESSRGSIPSRDAVKALIKLLKRSEDGYNLLIHVFRIPRITQAEENNYEFFIKTVAGSKVPALLVATGCEDFDPMSKWKDENGDNFARMGLDYADIVCTCFASGDGRLATIYDELRGESREALFNAIEEHASSESIKLYTSTDSFFALLKKSWNWLANWFGFDKLLFKINEGMIQLLIRIGFSKEEATALINEVDDL